MDALAKCPHAGDLYGDSGVEFPSQIVTKPATRAKDKYLVGFDRRFKRIFSKRKLGALRLICNLQATVRQEPRGAFALVTAHCIFTVAEIREGTEQNLTVEEFVSPNPLVVILEQTVAQASAPLTRLSQQYFTIPSHSTCSGMGTDGKIIPLCEHGL